MSRAYWVKLGSSIQETIKAGDKTSTKVDVKNICPEAEMEDILRKNLENEGWEKTGENEYEKEVEGVNHKWDVKTGKVEASLEEEEEVTEKVKVKSRGYNNDSAREQAKKDLKAKEDETRKKISNKEKALQKKISKRLAESESSRNEEVNKVLQGTYKDAIKRKARRMGRVTSEVESKTAEGGYELDITIEH